MLTKKNATIRVQFLYSEHKFLVSGTATISLNYAANLIKLIMFVRNLNTIIRTCYLYASQRNVTKCPFVVRDNSEEVAESLAQSMAIDV